MNLIRLSRLTGETELENYADQVGKAFSADLIRSGASICHSMQSVQFLNSESKELSLLAEPEELPETIRDTFSPFSVMHIITKKNSKALSEIAPYTSTQKKINGNPTLYICTDFMCKEPLSGLKLIKKALG